MEKFIEAIEVIVKDYYDQLKSSPPKLDNNVRLSAPAFDHLEAMRAISTILSGWISQGKNVKEFEDSFASYVGCSKGIATNSGSSANLLALHALKEVKGIEDGSEVIVPAATFATVSMPIIQAGMIPVYVDVESNSLNILSDQVEEAISDATKILMPVHTLGYPANMNQLMSIASKYNLAVLEDCCEAHGSKLNGQKVGSFGDIGTYSFFVAHNMTTGEGGMVVTNDSDIERLCRSYREFGRYQNESNEKLRYYTNDVLTDYDVRYVFDRLGYNLRMTDVMAAFGIEQLKKLDTMNKIRRSNATKFIQVLQTKTKGYLSSTVESTGHHHTYYTFPIIIHKNAPFNRRQFTDYLEERNIETRPLFGGCLPDQPGLRNAPGRIIGDLPNARYIRDNLVFIGIHPGLTKENIEYVSDTIISFIENHTND